MAKKRDGVGGRDATSGSVPAEGRTEAFVKDAAKGGRRSGAAAKAAASGTDSAAPSPAKPAGRGAAGKDAASPGAASPARATADSAGVKPASGKPATARPAATKAGAKAGATARAESDAAPPSPAIRSARPAARGAAAQEAARKRSPGRPVERPPVERPAAEPPAAAKAAPSPSAQADSGADGNPLALAELPARLAENIERIETLGQRLMLALAARPMHSPAVEGPGPELYGSVAQAWLKLATEQPARLIEQQVRFWGQTLRHVAAAQDAFARGMAAPEPAPDSPAAEDRRFKNPLWKTNPFYNFVMKQYQINADAIRQAAADLDIADETDRRRIDWFTRQMIDMLAPTNFLATNPDALERAIQTEGESLVRGLENLVRDIEANGGELVVSLADRNAFQVGENIATTRGEVVYRTDLFELIQYHPTTEQVHAIPVVVFPPWINKFYIMDLKPQNSLLRWIVDQGHTLFVVSWKNPGAGQAGLAMDDYVGAYLDVFGQVLKRTGAEQVNAVGYCIAGTTLSATLALMKQTGDDRVRSATFLTTLTDFSDQGEFTTFLQDDFIGGIEDEVSRTGYLSAQLMQRTFSFLRANDLVWGPAIRSYMLGEPPPAFDLLYWNGDGTNLPGRMVTQYLRDLIQQNALVRDGFDLRGHKVHLSEVTVPLCAIACEGDHIAPWLHSWQGVAQMGSRDKTFILSESGHVAGIINPPTKEKYGHYTSDAGFEGTPQDWRAAAQFHKGSWWGHWNEWLQKWAGPMVPARIPHESLMPAPGSYVLEKAR